MRKKSKHIKPTVKKIFNRIITFIVLFLVGVPLGLLSFDNKYTKIAGEDLMVEPFNHLSVSSIRISILLYHYVEYVTDKGDTIRKSLSIPPRVFENQITTLKDGGYTFMTASELADVLDGSSNPLVNPIIISFDDGYRNFYTDVFPILKDKKIKAVVYIVSDFLDKPNFLYTWQLKEIAKSGLIEIGAHTVHHEFLKGLSREKAFFEINKSKEILSQILNIPVVSFAYPYGEFDDQAVEIVRSVGFKTAATTMPGIEASQENKYKLYRIRPGQRTGNELLNFLKQSVFSDY